ncbi:retrotransposon hot spot (RHS) protein, putative [Trypanosoma cruzi marinkellei]|uniref:Retrotransposon hot spot (RHS) protein, putative n=1 Tax=Trypanosoma cruzi marinkellei TaxID=85056 RepID=K2MU79_TRYCR|nr:retrotransposon hot spot (RHS) protein, putative [Trypanosoma cruzi marinkellei]
MESNPMTLVGCG